MITAIVRKEILGSGRHGRYYAIRGVYLAMLACITIPTLYKAAERLQPNAYSASQFGKEFTLGFGILQFALVVLLAPVMSIGAIAGERDSGSLDLMHAAGVGAVRIITGKFVARMAWLGLIIASGVPLFFAGTLMGGAGAETVGLLAAHCAIGGALATALGFSLSGGLRHSVPALVICYMAVLGLYAAAPLALLIYSEELRGSVPTEWFAWLSPMAAVAQQAEGSLRSTLAWCTLIPQGLLALAALLPAVLFTRPGWNEVGAGRFRGASAVRKVRARSVYGNPVAWRDARLARRSLAARILRVAYLGLGSFLVVAVIGAVLYKRLQGDWSLFAILEALQNDGSGSDLCFIGLMLLMGGGGIVALVCASGVIAEEREGRVLPLLKLSRMSSLEILLGKMWGLLVYLWPMAVLPLALSSAFFFFNRFEAVVLTAYVDGAVLVICIGTGLFFSSFARKPAAAAGLSVAFAIFYCLVPLLVIEFFRSGQTGEHLLILVDPLVSAGMVTEKLGRHYGYQQEEMVLGMIGLAMQAIAGAGLAAMGLLALELMEEAT